MQKTINWIYDFGDYLQMYDLTAYDLSKTLFDFPAGVSSFNATATAQGVCVTSADPLYALSESDMRLYANRVYQESVAQLVATPRQLRDKSPAMLTRIENAWENAKNMFLADYAVGRSEKRYQSAALPTLLYRTHQFDLALCTDFIFTGTVPSVELEMQVTELCRVATEVRIFPLLDKTGEPSEQLGPLMLYLQQQQFGVEVREVAYKTLCGHNAMLRVWSHACEM